MAEHCKNCQEEIVLNFCGNCGQKKNKRIDGKYIKDELQYVLVHTNKGFFYSVKKLIKGPGSTAYEFIDGIRINHYKPILMVFLLAGISAFITNTYIHPVEIQQQFYDARGLEDKLNANGIASILMKYQSLVMLVSVPFMAIFSWLAFRKWGYNYYENVVANAYLLSAMLVFSIGIILPFQYFLRTNPTLFVIIPTVLSYLSMLSISVWFFIGLYPEKLAGYVILRVLLMYFLLFVSVSAIAIIGTIIYIAQSKILL